jgi:hypothetical protein
VILEKCALVIHTLTHQCCAVRSSLLYGFSRTCRSFLVVRMAAEEDLRALAVDLQGGAGCCASISKTFVIAACPHFAMYDGTVTNQKGSREVEEKQLCDTVVGLRLPLPRPMKMESVRTSISQPTKGVSPVKRWADSLDITRVGLSYLELETSGNTTTTTPSRYLGPRHVPRSHILFVELQFNFGLGRE